MSISSDFLSGTGPSSNCSWDTFTQLAVHGPKTLLLQLELQRWQVILYQLCGIAANALFLGEGKIV